MALALANSNHLGNVKSDRALWLDVYQELPGYTKRPSFGYSLLWEYRRSKGIKCYFGHVLHSCSLGYGTSVLTAADCFAVDLLLVLFAGD